MNKEEIIKLANDFWQESFEANLYYSIIKQYGENYKKYYYEIRCSSAFYSITHKALQEALFMKLSKLYDKSDRAINIKYLLKECKDNIILFPECRVIEEIDIDGVKRIIKHSFQHQIKPNEECYFKEEVESQKQIQKLIGLDETIPIIIDITAQGYIDLYEKKYHALSPKISNLITQRNKIYAHHDKEVCFNIENVISKNPIHYNDIKELIEYALDVSRFVIGFLDDINKPEQCVNINDWEGTLRLVQVGNKYKDVEVVGETREFMKKCFPDDSK